MATEQATLVYKNEDAKNPEYATFDEVKAAFMRNVLFVKDGDFIYAVESLNETLKRFYAGNTSFELATPPQ